ncbi:MAG: pentapeptide repeat-containing protein, partial [Pseudanabaenales cyanobacterium]|nr:pentapeptide repeat-containing protein [Pseudanabaenales cyanobacterium]
MSLFAKEFIAMGWRGVWAIALPILFGLIGLAQPTWAAENSSSEPLDLNRLTPELLEQRIQAPVPLEGELTIDLRRLVIDLRPGNQDFRDRFYRQLQTKLQSGGSPLALDLSDSLIQGDFNIQQLGLRTPLYGEALFPLLSEDEQAQFRQDLRRLTQFNQFSRSLLIQPEATATHIFIFRGPLRLAHTHFTGQVDASGIFFFGRVEAQGAVFSREANWAETHFSQILDFVGATFQQEVQFRHSIFFDQARFSQAQFQAVAN